MKPTNPTKIGNLSSVRNAKQGNTGGPGGPNPPIVVTRVNGCGDPMTRFEFALGNQGVTEIRPVTFPGGLGPVQAYEVYAGAVCVCNVTIYSVAEVYYDQQAQADWFKSRAD